MAVNENQDEAPENVWENTDNKASSLLAALWL